MHVSRIIMTKVIKLWHRDVSRCSRALQRISDDFKRNNPHHFAHLQIVHGNALNVSNKGESVIRFDRTCVGASVGKSNFPNFTRFLSPGKTLMGLLKVILRRFHVSFHYLNMAMIKARR